MEKTELSHSDEEYRCNDCEAVWWEDAAKTCYRCNSTNIQKI